MRGSCADYTYYHFIFFSGRKASTSKCYMQLGSSMLFCRKNDLFLKYVIEDGFRNRWDRKSKCSTLTGAQYPLCLLPLLNTDIKFSLYSFTRFAVV